MKAEFMIEEGGSPQLRLTVENAEERVFLLAAFRHDIEFVDSSFIEDSTTLIVRYRPK